MLVLSFLGGRVGGGLSIREGCKEGGIGSSLEHAKGLVCRIVAVFQQFRFCRIQLIVSEMHSGRSCGRGNDK